MASETLLLFNFRKLWIGVLGICINNSGLQAHDFLLSYTLDHKISSMPF